METEVDIYDYLTQQAISHPEYSHYWTSFRSSYFEGLWHQLTIRILQFLRLPDINKIDLLPFYTNFISDFETKLNPLSLVEIITPLVKQMSSKQEIGEAIAFLQKIKEKVKSDQNATLLCSILIARIKLANNDLEGVKEILDEIGPIIDEQTGITPVHGRYFQLSSNYHQIIGNHGEYYRNALRFLGCTKMEEEPPEELEQRAFALALAALLGDSIFNFGELLQHPIVEHLKEKHSWLIELLYAFNSGNLEKYESLRPSWSAQPDLATFEMQLKLKISLLCLMEMAFVSSNGVLTFDEIAVKTHIDEDKIELLVMKALALGLVRGTIDEIDRKVCLNWVQPRVLDKDQIASLRNKIDNWSKDVHQMEKLLSDRVSEMIIG